jgi:hypothetical protein
MANVDEESTHIAEVATAKSHSEETELKEAFGKKYCVCPSRLSSEFTSSAQPPNLDDIERRMK